MTPSSLHDAVIASLDPWTHLFRPAALRGLAAIVSASAPTLSPFDQIALVKLAAWVCAIDDAIDDGDLSDEELGLLLARYEQLVYTRSCPELAFDPIARALSDVLDHLARAPQGRALWPEFARQVMASLDGMRAERDANGLAIYLRFASDSVCSAFIVTAAAMMIGEPAHVPALLAAGRHGSIAIRIANDLATWEREKTERNATNALAFGVSHDRLRAMAARARRSMDGALVELPPVLADFTANFTDGLLAVYAHGDLDQHSATLRVAARSGEAGPCDGGYEPARAQVGSMKKLLMLALVGACTTPARPAPATQAAIDLPTTTAVGTSTRVWTDASRAELATPDPSDARRLVVQLYYPAAFARHDAPYLGAAEGEAMATDTFPAPGWIDAPPEGWQDLVRTHAGSEAPVVEDGQRHPVIIFSHELGFARQFYTGLALGLAGQGFVVAEISHLYDTAPLAIDGTMMPLSAFDLAPSTADLDAHVSLWADDQAFVLDRLAELDLCDEQNIFTDRLDLAHVGAVGHGFGGAAAIALAQRDPGITGVVDIDGFVYGPARTATTPLPVPLLVLEARHDVGDSTDALWEAGTVGAQEPMAGAGPLGFTDLGRIGNGLGLPANPAAFGDTDVLAATVEKVSGFFPR